MNREKEREDFETHFRSLPPYNESHEFMLERKKDGTYKFSNVQEYFIKWQARAALSTEAQPEVTGAVAYLDYNGVLKPTRDGVVSMKKGDNLYPASAIKAAEARIRELEADAKRYRWLRDKSEYGDDFYLSVPFESPRDTFKPHEVDEAIDRAMKREHKENQDGN